MSLFIYIICIEFVQVFSNYTYYEVIAFSTHEREFLQNALETHGYAYFLNGVTNEASTLMDVVVDSCCTELFEGTLTKFNIDYTLVTQQELYPLDVDIKDRSLKQHVLHTFLNWDDILLWVEKKVKENSALTKTVIAKTYEHRDIFVLKVSAEKTDKKMSVFMVAGEEGRDWLSSALLLNYIDRILDSIDSPQSLLNYFDIYFVPIFNPDGFVYTKEKDRMWTKNRKLIEPTQSCTDYNPAIGVNIDQNWFTTISDSRHACDPIFLGSKALSQEETQGLSYILNSIALKLLACINLRGFANLITIPYADAKEKPPNSNIVMEIMKHTSAVLNIQYNKSYPVGTTASYFYNFTGNMPDWIKMKLNIPIVFTVYMQHENFLPKESHILPLTEQLESLLNISLIISKEMYGSLYNTQMKISSSIILVVFSIVYASYVNYF